MILSAITGSVWLIYLINLLFITLSIIYLNIHLFLFIICLLYLFICLFIYSWLCMDIQEDSHEQESDWQRHHVEKQGKEPQQVIHNCSGFVVEAEIVRKVETEAACNEQQLQKYIHFYT